MSLKQALRVEAITIPENMDDPIMEVNTKGEISSFTFTDENFLPTFYNAIGCDYVEGVDLPSLGVRMWLDEEGKLKNDTPINVDGTILYQMEYDTKDFIVGNIAFTSIKVDDEGWIMGLTEGQVSDLVTLLSFIRSTRSDKAYLTSVMNDGSVND